MIHNAHIGIAVKRWPLGIAEMMACWGVEVKQWPVEALQWNNNQKSAKVNRWPRRRRSRKDDEKTIHVGTMWTWREKESRRMMESPSKCHVSRASYAMWEEQKDDEKSIQMPWRRAFICHVRRALICHVRNNLRGMKKNWRRKTRAEDLAEDPSWSARLKKKNTVFYI